MRVANNSWSLQATLQFMVNTKFLRWASSNSYWKPAMCQALF